MKRVYYFLEIICFLYFSVLIKADDPCLGLKIPFSINGENCNVSGEISFSFDPTNNKLYGKRTSVESVNFDIINLCFNLLSLNGNSGNCQTFDTSESGNFTLRMSYCFNTANTIFETVGAVYYNSSGMQPEVGECNNNINFTCTNADKLTKKVDINPLYSEASIDDYCISAMRRTTSDFSPDFFTDTSTFSTTTIQDLDPTTQTDPTKTTTLKDTTEFENNTDSTISTDLTSTTSFQDFVTSISSIDTTQSDNNTTTTTDFKLPSSTEIFQNITTTITPISDIETTTDLIITTQFDNDTDSTTASPYNNHPWGKQS